MKNEIGAAASAVASVFTTVFVVFSAEAAAEAAAPVSLSFSCLVSFFTFHSVFDSPNFLATDGSQWLNQRSDSWERLCHPEVTLNKKENRKKLNLKQKKQNSPRHSEY